MRVRGVGRPREALRSRPRRRPRPRIRQRGVMEYWSVGVLRQFGIARRVRGVGSAFRAHHFNIEPRASASVDSDFNARGYRFTTGGLDLGADYRILSTLALGVMGVYVHSWTDLRPGPISVNSGRVGLYATYFNGVAQGGTFNLTGGCCEGGTGCT